MANTLIGASFSDFVQKQINIRQDRLGINQGRNTEWLIWKNSNTAFVRLASSIDVNNDGGTLAQKYPLFNTKFGGKITSGVDLNNTNSTYGWNTDNKSGYGYTIPPGILSAEIKAKNRGSLREATVEMVCHNKSQFEIISKLYLRLGYTMLLEWGWSNFYDNTGAFVQNYHNVATPSYFFAAGSTPETILHQINVDRKKSCGNYDAIVGKVSNYSWNLEKDGSFKITLNLVTWGDITESLKSNSSTVTTPQKPVDPNAPQLTFLETKANKSDLNRILSALATYIFNGTNPYNPNSSYFPTPGGMGTANAFGPIVQQSLAPSPSPKSIDKIENYWINTNTGLKQNQNHDPGANAKGELIQLIFKNLEQTTTGGVGINTSILSPNVIHQQQYIKLGALLRIMQNYTLMYNTANTANPALVNVYPQNGELIIPCFKLQNSISLDPRVCIIPFKKTFYGNVTNSQPGLSIPVGAPLVTIPSDPSMNHQTFLDTNSSFNAGDYIGRAEEIHININHIAKVLDSYIVRDTGAISVYDFLQNLMKDIQSALGNINNFEVIYDEDTNEIKIIDSTPIPGIETLFPNVDFSSSTPFVLSTMDQDNGSFLRDAKIQSKLSNNFASQTTISAQSNGEVVGEDTTLLSKFNDGLIDRLVETKQNKNNEDAKKTLLENRPARFQYEVETDYGTITPEFIDGYKQTLIDYFRLQINYAVNKGVMPPIGLLPVDLELTMDGLSGIKIYENYFVDGKLLPDDYKDSIKFVTTGVSHKIQNNDWTTTLNSLLSPLGKTVPPSVSQAAGTIINGASTQTSIQTSNQTNTQTNNQTNNQTNTQSQQTRSTPLPLNKCGLLDFSKVPPVVSIRNGKPQKPKYRKTGKFDKTQIDNILVLDNYLIKYGYTTPESRIAALSVCGKECNYRPKNENAWGYSIDSMANGWAKYFKENNSKVKYMSIYDFETGCRTNHCGQKYGFSGVGYGSNPTPADYNPIGPNGEPPDINTKTKNTAAHLLGYIYTHTYIPSTGEIKAGKGGNKPGANGDFREGWQYRGRGFNGITFKDLYQKMQKFIVANEPNLLRGKDISVHPNMAMVNEIPIASICVVAKFSAPNVKKGSPYGYNGIMQSGFSKELKKTVDEPKSTKYHDTTDIYNLIWTLARDNHGWNYGWSGAEDAKKHSLLYTQALIDLYETNPELQKRSNNWKYCSGAKPLANTTPAANAAASTGTNAAASTGTNAAAPAVTSAKSWQSVATKFIVGEEGFASKAMWDQNAYRMGFGSDKIIKNGKLVTVQKGMTCTRAEAVETFEKYSLKEYSDQVIKDLGQANWDKLNENQKAALISLAYNAGKYFISARGYGKKIKRLIEQGNLQKAGETIYTDGPKSGAQDGYIPALARRRKKEAELFNTPVPTPPAPPQPVVVASSPPPAEVVDLPTIDETSSGPIFTEGEEITSPEKDLTIYDNEDQYPQNEKFIEEKSPELDEKNIGNPTIEKITDKDGKEYFVVGTKDTGYSKSQDQNIAITQWRNKEYDKEETENQNKLKSNIKLTDNNVSSDNTINQEDVNSDPSAYPNYNKLGDLILLNDDSYMYGSKDTGWYKSKDPQECQNNWVKGIYNFNPIQGYLDGIRPANQTTQTSQVNIQPDPTVNKGSYKLYEASDGDYIVGTKETGWYKSGDREIAKRKWKKGEYNYTPSPGSPLLL